MASDTKSILLFNPWIYDFAAYDFWAKPLGLLYVGAVLRQLGYHIELLDCLDRFHPHLLDFTNHHLHFKNDFSGKFYREVIDKPECLSFVPRRFARYGMPPGLVRKILSTMTPPDVILVTSHMTYWYPAVRDAVDVLRECFPQSTIILGGIYATLCPQHAKDHIKADFIISGEGEVQTAHLVADVLGGPGADFSYNDLDELPVPAFDLYPELNSLPLLTSRGCPNNCSFCASRSLTAGYRRRSVQHILDEIRYWHEEFDVSHFAFSDDALLHRADRYAKPFLRHLQQKNWNLHFYTPNGLTPRFVDAEIAELFYNNHVSSIRLSFETTNEDRQKAMSAKVTNNELADALMNLERAGYDRNDIGVYVLIGLPGQTINEAQHSVRYVHDLGARVNVASFSPIPGTAEWRNAVEQQLWQPDADLLLTNTTIYPIWSNTIGFEKCEEFMHWTFELNQQR
jgi:radical SAM superfamily enzyme YgiQ (UPF0313 family)